MAKLSNYGVFIAGFVSPLAAPFFYVLVYLMLKRASSDLKRDWLLRLSLSAVAMTLPFLVTLVLAMKDHRHQGLFVIGQNRLCKCGRLTDSQLDPP